MVGAAARLACAALALAHATPAVAATVEAGDYSAFWLWAGVRPQPALERAERVYLLEGEVRAGEATKGQPVHLVSLRPAVPRVRGAAVWLAVRVETLDWPAEIAPQLFVALDRWRAAGNRVAGLQIDFDARTRHLAAYAAFLSALRQQLPARYRLGITGLLDWSANGDPAGLDALRGTVDEAVLQIYQGRHVISGYAAYLAKLDRMKVPFRIGLLQGGEWEAPGTLAGNPLFRGYVVFLVNR